MDVAKYIGLFLLKNNKCYVHGLGTLEMKRKSAQYDGESLHASNLEIVLSTSGNIDESLANYIATNEQISISKATKSLNDFSAHVKAKIKEGDTVSIPSLGKVAEENGNIYFVTAPQLLFTPPPIKAPKTTATGGDDVLASVPRPTQANFPPVHAQPQSGYSSSPQPVEQSMSNDSGSDRINWSRIIIVLVVIAALIGGTYFVWKKFIAPSTPQNQTIAPPTLPENDYSDSAQNFADTNAALIDTLNNKNLTDDSTLNNTTDLTTTNTPQKTIKLRIVLNTYDKKDKAQKRYKQLMSYGNKVEIIEEDTNYFFVAMPIQASPTDTARILDSLSRNFNPDGVFIY